MREVLLAQAKSLRAQADALEAIAATVDASAPSDVYTSKRLPPDCPSSERFHEVCRNIAGANQRGRVWLVPSASWDSHRANPRKTEQVTDVHAAAIADHQAAIPIAA